MALPPHLERYLPSYLWQKLAGDKPGQGVLLNVLERLRSVLYLLSTYLPSHLVQEQLRHPVPGHVRGQWLSGSLLFSDVSGFTALSERLATQGQEVSEQLTRAVNDYFEKMLDTLARSGGILVKFAGDALLAYFPEQAEGRGQEQARWATRAAQRMMQAMSDFAAFKTPLGTVTLRMKIGLSTGHFWAASIGSARRMEYIILGEAVAQAMAAEGAAEAGQVIVDKTTAAALDSPERQLNCTPIEQEPDFYAVNLNAGQDPGEFEIKAETARRARGAGTWLASRDELEADIQSVLRQIEALTPYLSAELVERIVASAQQRQLESEYRPTTVLFINLTGFESLLPNWDPSATMDNSPELQAVTHMLSDYFDAMYQVVARHGGIISRIDPYKQGSKMLVLFGAPVAHEDDPQRAVRAALAMNAELARLNERWSSARWAHAPPGPTGPLIQQRIGITQGVTFAGQAGSSTRREYTVMGDDVNLAARLMAAAQPGQILVSRRVYELVADHFDATSLPAIRVKGKRKPVPIYQVNGLRDDRLAHRLRDQGALLGREDELERGQAIVQQALAGRGTLFTIRGPAGIGKSHLADTLAAHALAQGARVLLSECASYTSAAPYAAWMALVHAAASIKPGDPPGVQAEKLAHLLNAIGGVRDEHQNALFNWLGLPRITTPAASQQPAALPKRRPGASLFSQVGQKVAGRFQEAEVNLWQLTQTRQQAQAGQLWQRLEAHITAREQARVFAAICELLKQLAAGAPLLIFLENAQWMDPASRELLQYVSERMDAWPILALVVQRDEGEGSPIQETGASPTMTLGPLSQQGTHALVTYLLKDETIQADLLPLAQAIYEQSGGNPLFIEEIIQWLRQTGLDNLALQTADDVRGLLRRSSTLQELVISRLDSLPYIQRSAVTAASVVGDEFCISELAPLLADSSESATLDDALAGLVQARLIVPVEAAAETYAFRQTLIRELVYDSQSFARRRELHTRIADYLNKRYAQDLAPHIELLAHHYELAQQWLPAAHSMLLCGHKARQRYAYAQAANYYGRALAALEHLPADETSPDISALKAQVCAGQGDISLLTGDLAAAAFAYGEARAGLPPAPDQATQVGLLMRLSLVLPTQEQAAEAAACARQAWEAHLAESEAAAAAILAWLAWRAGSSEAGEWIERAVTSLGPRDERRAAGLAALAADLGGEWARAAQAYQALDQPTGAALATCRLGDSHLAARETAQALALYDQAAATWGEENDACGLALARYRQAEAQWRNRDAAAAATLQAALALLDTCAAADPDRQVIQAALASVNANQDADWPTWHWQRYDDAFRIALLFQLLIH